MIVVMMVMVAQRVFASHKQCACTDNYRFCRQLQPCGTVCIYHYERRPSQGIIGMMYALKVVSWGLPEAGVAQGAQAADSRPTRCDRHC